MELIYRGQTINVPSTVQAYRKPRGLNWRYQVEGEMTCEERAIAPSYRQPQAVNWRYQ